MVSELAQPIYCLFEEHGPCDFVVTHFMLYAVCWTPPFEVTQCKLTKCTEIFGTPVYRPTFWKFVFSCNVNYASPDQIKKSTIYF